MQSDIFLISVSVTLLVLSAVLIALLFALNRTLGALLALLKDLRKDAAPLLDDVRAISRNLGAASEGMRNSMQRVNRVADVFGSIGEDIDEGRRAVKGGVKRLGEMVGPWLARLRE